jgi:hypothetical protein
MTLLSAFFGESTSFCGICPVYTTTLFGSIWRMVMDFNPTYDGGEVGE